MSDRCECGGFRYRYYKYCYRCLVKKGVIKDMTMEAIL